MNQYFKYVIGGMILLFAAGVFIRGNTTLVDAVADTTPPTVTITSPISGATLSGTFTITATATDNVAVTKVEFYYDTTLISSDTTAPYSVGWDSTTAPNGSHTLSAKAYDAANNTKTSPAIPITLNYSGPDNHRPVVSISEPSAGATINGTVTIAATATDNVAVSKVDFYRGTTLMGTDTTAPYSISWNTTTVANGTYDLTAKAWDPTSNWRQSSIVSVNVNNTAVPPPDTTLPTVAITSPVAGNVSGTITITATASDNVAVSKVEFYKDTTLIGTDTSAPYSMSWNTTLYTDGTRKLKAVATDSSGNIANSSIVSVYILNNASDTTPPAVTMTAPSSGATVGGTVNLSAAASDNIGVIKVDFYKDTDLIGTDTSAPYSINWDSTAVSNGSYTLFAKAYDGANNTTYSATIPVTVSNTSIPDTTAPSVALIAPVENATITGTTTISATATDDVGVTKVEFYRGTTLISSDTTTPYSATWNTTTLANGPYALSAKAYDAANNSTVSPVVNVTVNNTVGTPTVWEPDHTVLVFMENRTASQIKPTVAPYIVNTLRPLGRYFSNFYGVITNGLGNAHTSQTQYLHFFSGSNQGMTTNSCITTPFNTPNLGSELIAAGKSWAWYNEGLPSAGSTTCSSGNYFKRHNAASDWQGTGTYQYSGTTYNLPFTAFPTDFTKLPKVSIITPDICDDMHDTCSTGSAITQGDTWLSQTMDSYIKWARDNNSLFILYFDESDPGGAASDVTYTLMIGPEAHVPKNSTDNTLLNHYSMLRYIEDAYGTATHAANAATATKIVLP